jgi:hypothetical protein
MAILRSLIHQLLVRRRVLVKHIKDAYDRYGPQFDQNFNELWRIFIALASDKRVGNLSVIVDAIDDARKQQGTDFCATLSTSSASRNRATQILPVSNSFSQAGR